MPFEQTQLLGLWQPPPRVGSRMRRPNGKADAQYLGTFLKRLRGESALDDFALLEKFDIPLTELDAYQVVGDAPQPSPTSYAVSKELASAFDHVLLNLGKQLTKNAIEQAHEMGFRILLVGGPVRDVLLGRVALVNDLDLAGDMPQAAFRDLACYAAIEAALPNDREGLKEAWLPRLNVAASGVVHGYRIEGSGGRRGGGFFTAAKFIEYATFKVNYLVLRDGDDEPSFVFGDDAAEDVKWRDVGLNTLLYDPVARTVIDPATALGDLGLRPRDVQQWSGSRVDEGRIIVDPLDIPERAPSFWAGKAAARSLKAIAKFPDADTRPFAEWVERNASPIRAALELQADDRAAFMTHLAPALGSGKTMDDTAFFGVAERLLHVVEGVAPGWFVGAARRQLVEAEAATVSRRGRAGEPRAFGPGAVGAVYLKPAPSGNGFDLGSDVTLPTNGDPETTGRYLAERFGHFASHVVELRGVGLVLAFTDGELWVAEVDDTGAVRKAPKGLAATAARGEGAPVHASTKRTQVTTSPSAEHQPAPVAPAPYRCLPRSDVPMGPIEWYGHGSSGPLHAAAGDSAAPKWCIDAPPLALSDEGRYSAAVVGDAIQVREVSTWVVVAETASPSPTAQVLALESGLGFYAVMADGRDVVTVRLSSGSRPYRSTSGSPAVRCHVVFDEVHLTDAQGAFTGSFAASILSEAEGGPRSIDIVRVGDRAVWAVIPADRPHEVRVGSGRLSRHGRRLDDVRHENSPRRGRSPIDAALWVREPRHSGARLLVVAEGAVEELHIGIAT